MKTYLLAAAATAAAIASPAFAGADGPYVGIEGGVALPQTTDLDVILNNTSVTPNTSATYPGGYRVKSKTGYDVDLLAGFKLGLLRLEAEGGYQRAKVKSLTVSAPLLTDVGTASGTAVTAANFPAGNHVGVTKLMANALLDSDFGSGSRFGGYIGGGAGRAWTSYTGSKESAWAYQGIAGLRYALTPNIDAGVKYQYFRTANLNFGDAFAVNGTNFTTSSRGHFASNNVLASLVYNFNSREAAEAPPPPPPPPPPPAPATQTCADGSVIDATATCPAPAPPPPPPPPPAQRGERG
jgi:opacity protein-like surface antigen